MDPERADRVEQLYHSALEHDTARARRISATSMQR